MNTLVKFWDEAGLRSAPFIHPRDDEAVGAERPFSDRTVLNHRTFTKSQRFGQEVDKSFHLSLMPVPFQGNLRTADIFIVLLNPGLGLSDYLVQDTREHTRQLRKILRQDFRGIDYPFLSLNPEFAWSGGFMWWEKKLRRVLREIADDRFCGSYLEALKFLSNRIASIELVPYHSKTFGAQGLMTKMPSVFAAKKYIEQTLVPQAIKRKITVIAMRQVNLLKLPRSPNVVQYDRALARGAHLGPKTLGGEAILRQIGKRRAD